MARRTGAPVLALALAGLALTAGIGCGDESAIDASPAEALAAVSGAGAQTFAEPTLSLDLRVASPGASYEATGLLEPKRGRFRVELHEISSPSDYRPRVVVGLDGEGFENTVEETTDGLFGGPRGERCWFNPHAPVGSSLGTASVEESVRVTGAVLESLGEELRSATAADGDLYDVRLDSSATRPRDDFRETKGRVWGERKLLTQLKGPIEVRLSGSATVEQITLRLSDYELVRGFSGNLGDTIPRVRIEATLASTDRDLVLLPPQCQAIE